MGIVTIQDFTTKEPISMIGYEAGVCWGRDVSNKASNYRRGIDCLTANHGRTFEFPDVYMTLDGYSARVIREWYTHIGGSPTRLQASTRYIDYNNFKYIIPPNLTEAQKIWYEKVMRDIMEGYKTLYEDLQVPKEDCALVLPLGMQTKIVCKHNLRNLIDMSHQRMCTRAYWEYRKLFNDVAEALKNYSPEWKTVVENHFKPKCEICNYCIEKNSCGRKPRLIEE